MRVGEADVSARSVAFCVAVGILIFLLMTNVEVRRQGEVLLGLRDAVEDSSPSNPSYEEGGPLKLLVSPSSMIMDRPAPPARLVVGDNNIERPDARCFCVHPHLRGLVGPGSRELALDRDFASLRAANPDGAADAIEVIKDAAPDSCWRGLGQCRPNTWFTGNATLMVPGEQGSELTLVVDLPDNSRDTPNGDWRFDVDVCAYPVSRAGTCDTCIPERCTRDPRQGCTEDGGDDCTWFDTAGFELLITEAEG